MTQPTSPPSLPAGNYFEVSIVNNTHANNNGSGSDNGVSNDDLYISLVSQTQAYNFTQYTNSAAQTVYVATVDTPSGSSVASIPVSQLQNGIDNTLGFYVHVYDTAPIAFTGGRIYFSTQQDAVPYAGGLPGGIAPDASFAFDFVEFTVDAATNQLNLDTTQVDQFGMPIYLQVSPVVPDFADGTGIIQTQTRAGVISAFQSCTKDGTFAAYGGAVVTTPPRLLAPQHVIDGNPGGTTALQQTFDAALYNLFNYYYSGTGGGSNTLYLTGNGSNGAEIFSGQVIANFSCQDMNDNTGTYTVFQFTGSGYYYNGADATLTAVSSGGGATYQIFYPYFANNTTNSSNASLSSGSDAPYWFGQFSGTNVKYNLPLTSAGRMAFGASGVFADNVSQQAYYQAQNSLPGNFDPVMLGNLENQLVTMLNRGISPDAGGTTNMHLRTGSNTANDLIYADLLQAQNGATGKIDCPQIPSSAITSCQASSILSAAEVPAGNTVLWNQVSGTIYMTPSGSKTTYSQTFAADPNDITQPFTLGAPTASAPNALQSVTYDNVTNGVPTSIYFNWESAVDLDTATIKAEFSIEYAPATTEAHYATLHLFSPYGKTQLTFQSGNLGPTSNFSTNLVGATNGIPESGMTVTGIGLSNPTYVYQASTTNPDAITIYSPQALSPINTNILAFSNFYPTDAQGDPVGAWNAYAAFFHTGLNGSAAPTVDGKGYAFAFDDNGGYSSDITVQLPATTADSNPVTTLSLTLLPWGWPFELEEQP